MDLRTSREVLAVAAGPLAIADLSAILEVLGERERPSRGALAKKGEQGLHVDYSRAWLDRGSAEPIVRALIRDGRYSKIAAVIAAIQPLKIHAWGYYGDEGPVLREARRAMLAGDFERWCQITEARPTSIAPFVSDPLDLAQVRSLSPEFQGLVLAELTDRSLLFAEAMPGLPDLARELAAAPGISQAGAEVAASLAILVGRFDEAASLAGRFALPGIAGLLELVRGDVSPAAASCAKELALQRERVGRRNIVPRGLAGALLPLVLLLEGSPTRRKQALALIAFVRKELNGESGLPFDGWPALAHWADPALPTGRVGAHPVAVLLVGLTEAWSDRSLPETTLEAAVAGAEALGWTWIAAELRALRDPSAALPGTTPLVTRCERLADWERQLAKVEARLATDKPEASTRLVWRFSLDPLVIEAREQVRQKSQWSAGKQVGWSRLLGGGKRLATTEADNRVLRCIRSEVEWYTTRYTWLVPDVYQALAEHPQATTFDGQRLTVVTRRPRLEVRRTKTAVEVAVVPPLPESGVTVEVVGTAGVEITVFEASHTELARHLGAGLKVPKASAARLQGALERLGDVFEMADQGAEATEVPGDPAPVVQLWPEGRGISARTRVRPLGDTGPAVSAGRGGPLVLGTREGRPVRARRAPEEEVARAQALFDAVPALLPPFPDGEVPIGGVPEVLDLLAALREREVAVEWPHGAEIRLRASVGRASSVSVSSSKTTEWFAVTGEVAVDGELSLSLAELLRRMADASGRFVPLDDGSWLALTDKLQRQLDALERVGRLEKGELRVHPLAADLVQELLDDSGKSRVDARWRAHLAQRAEAWVEPPIPAGMSAELRPYQVDGFRWLARLAHLGIGACLADDMGLGKTVTALALLLHRSAEGPALVVAPTSVGAVWRAEAYRFAPGLVVYPAFDGAAVQALPVLGPGDLVVCSYGVLVSQIEALARRSWATVVADEAQQVKNADTFRHKALTQLPAAVRVALTGTPIENHLGDLWSLFAFLNPGLLGPSAQFLRRFARPIETGDRAVQRQLHRLVSPFVLRRTKSAVLSDLPSRTEIDRVVDLGPAQAALYEAVRREALEAVERGGTDAMQLLSHLTRLRLAACHPRLVSDSVDDAGAAKLAAFVELVDTLRGSDHRALVFSQFVRHLTLVREHLDAEGISYQYLDGETPVKEREKRVAAFQRGEGLLFLISLRAGGFGLNLTAADYVVHLDPWWNPAVEDQASDRAHRIGQTRPVTVYRLVARGTIEERILELHRTKRDLADRLLTGTDTAARLGTAEMLELLGAEPA